jgi:hypothetical protein
MICHRRDPQHRWEAMSHTIVQQQPLRKLLAMYTEDKDTESLLNIPVPFVLQPQDVPIIEVALGKLVIFAKLEKARRVEVRLSDMYVRSWCLEMSKVGSEKAELSWKNSLWKKHTSMLLYLFGFALVVRIELKLHRCWSADAWCMTFHRFVRTLQEIGSYLIEACCTSVEVKPLDARRVCRWCRILLVQHPVEYGPLSSFHGQEAA